MKKITINQVNLKVSDPGIGYCDFCLESNKELINGHELKFQIIVSNWLGKVSIHEDTDTPAICYDCIKQLAKLI